MFLGAFALLVGLTGGASRYDAIQIVPLRALSCLLLVPALYYLTVGQLRKERVLLTLFGVLVLLIAVQLVPLPPFVWQELPGREGIVRLDEALGLQDVWRPLTMAPMRTWNALGGLIVPAVGILLAISLRASSRVLLQLIAGLGIFNALLGMLQVFSDRFGPLYFYEVTNRGGAVGIFANENHAGIFAAVSMLVVADLGLRARVAQTAKWMQMLYPAAFFLIFLVALVGGSRAGFAASLGAALVSFCMFLLAPKVQHRGSVADPVRKWASQHPRVIPLLALFAIVLTVSLFLVLERAPAFADLLNTDSFADLRWLLWPSIKEMVGIHWIVGSGFGSFEQVYKIIEPTGLLMPRYVNQAHNDWVQFIIEGGAIAGVLLLATLFWLARAVTKLAKVRSKWASAFFWFSIFAIIGGASLIDYPLRTPVFQVIGVWLLLALSQDQRDLSAT